MWGVFIPTIPIKIQFQSPCYMWKLYFCIHYQSNVDFVVQIHNDSHSEVLHIVYITTGTGNLYSVSYATGSLIITAFDYTCKDNMCLNQSHRSKGGKWANSHGLTTISVQVFPITLYRHNHIFSHFLSVTSCLMLSQYCFTFHIFLKPCYFWWCEEKSLSFHNVMSIKLPLKHTK